jgi:hypothetical protein
VKLADLRRDVQNAGLGGALLNIGYRGHNKLTRFMALTMLSVTPETVDASFLAGRSEHEHRFLQVEELERYSGDPVNEMPPDFVAEAVARGDRCFAIMHEGRLAAYGWYSQQETPVTAGLSLRFAPEWAYMYKGFTRPEYRGQRLHAIGMAKAMKAYADEGARGLVSYVEANNFSSLKSCYRMGYVKVGTIVALRMPGRYLIRVGRGCAPLGLDLRPTTET